MGVRRIGKSRLIDHYREHDPQIAVVSVRMDSATSTAPIFLRTMVRETVNALARWRGMPLVGRPANDAEVATAAGALGRGVADLVLRALTAASARKVDAQYLLEMGLAFPETVSKEADEPLLVIADEFQHIADLAVYPPFEGARRRAVEDARSALLGVVRASIERPSHVGWVVTGSSVRLLQHMLGTGPLMGRFDIVRVEPFDVEDCVQLADALWGEAGVEALNSARSRVFRLTQGHPFYADIACREAVNTGRRLGEPISAAMVDGAFVAAILQPQGQIAIACKEMYDSLGTRAPGLRGFLDVLAIIEPASIAEIAERMGAAGARALYRYADDLMWMGIVQPVENSRYAFADPVFRYWIARANDPTTAVPSPFDAATSRALARGYEEAYLREREIHGTLSEGYIRDLCRSFAGQLIEGKRFGRSGVHVRLPEVDQVATAFAHDTDGAVHGKPADVELDLCFGTGEVWLGEVKRTASRADGGDIALLERKARFLRKALGLPEGPTWFVSLHGFKQAALVSAQEKVIYTSNLQDIQAIRAAVGTRRPD